jgi:hypothetical protein
MRSKIKIRTSLADKAQLASLANEVRILIFDDPAENYYSISRNARSIVLLNLTVCMPCMFEPLQDFLKVLLQSTIHTKFSSSMCTHAKTY